MLRATTVLQVLEEELRKAVQEMGARDQELLLQKGESADLRDKVHYCQLRSMCLKTAQTGRHWSAFGFRVPQFTARLQLAKAAKSQQAVQVQTDK